jgi:hypothetical protein
MGKTKKRLMFAQVSIASVGFSTKVWCEDEVKTRLTKMRMICDAINDLEIDLSAGLVEIIHDGDNPYLHLMVDGRSLINFTLSLKRRERIVEALERISMLKIEARSAAGVVGLELYRPDDEEEGMLWATIVWDPDHSKAVADAARDLAITYEVPSDTVRSVGDDCKIVGKVIGAAWCTNATPGGIKWMLGATRLGDDCLMRAKMKQRVVENADGPNDEPEVAIWRVPLCRVTTEVGMIECRAVNEDHAKARIAESLRGVIDLQHGPIGAITAKRGYTTAWAIDEQAKVTQVIEPTQIEE